eukprot:scaffold1255_cov120-Isochrysis_galbana.AAC.11
MEMEKTADATEAERCQRPSVTLARPAYRLLSANGPADTVGEGHRGIINQGNPAVGRESGGGPGDGGVGHLLAGPYSGELWGTPTPAADIAATTFKGV